MSYFLFIKKESLGRKKLFKRRIEEENQYIGRNGVCHVVVLNGVDRHRERARQYETRFDHRNYWSGR